MLPYEYVVPTYNVEPGADDKAIVPERSTVGHYLQMYDWDSCFFSQAGHRIDAPDLSKSVVSNFLGLKHNDGYIPRTVSPERIWDSGDLCKPFLAQTLLFWWDRGKRKQPIPSGMIQDFDCYFKYIMRKRRHIGTGLFHWRNVLESGVDDNLALIYPIEAEKDSNEELASYPDGIILPVDYNTYLVMEFLAFSELCAAVGQTELSNEYKIRSQELRNHIEALLWHDQINVYLNLDPRTMKHVPVLSWTCLTPVLLGISSAERTERVLTKIMLSDKHFLRPSGLASMSSSELLYNQSPRGMYGRAIVSNWQGPMWVLPNVLAARCLLREKRENAAVDIASRVVRTLLGGIDATGTTFENYDAETGKPLWAPQFISWNMLTLELIDLLE
jgi:hypothetical protein